MILVDGVQEHEAPGLRYKRWSHLVSTVGEDELHQFAARLGLKRSWARLRPKSSAAHYDVVPAKRAISTGFDMPMRAVSIYERDQVELELGAG